ncbi:MAG: glycosyltransferase family 61 protein [Bacteroidota bacterium]
MKTIFPESVSLRKAPLNINNQDEALFAHEYKAVIHKSTLLTVRNAYVLNNMILCPSHFRFYNDYSLIHPIKYKDYIKNFLLLKKKSIRVKSAVWITDENAYGYFHWLTDCLPRLIVAEASVTNHVVLLPKRLETIRFIQDSLNFFNIKSYYYDCNISLKIKQLLLPSHCAPSGNYNVITLNKLRQKIAGNLSEKPTRNIYISRQKAEKRKVLNETAVIALLKQFNFEVHFFEDYSFAHQVELMKESKCLVGLHGAGLTNMLFMQERTKILEFRNTNDAHNNCYFSLASDLNIDYYYQLSQGDTIDTHEVNLTIDLNVLKSNLEAMFR